MPVVAQHVTQLFPAKTAVFSAHWTHGHASADRCCKRSGPRSGGKHNTIRTAPPLRCLDKNPVFIALGDTQDALTIFYLSPARNRAL